MSAIILVEPTQDGVEFSRERADVARRVHKFDEIAMISGGGGARWEHRADMKIAYRSVCRRRCGSDGLFHFFADEMLAKR